MTVPEALQRILAGWVRREEEIQRRLATIRDEQIALTSLLRTVERQRTAAEVAVSVAADSLPGSNGSGVPSGTPGSGST